MADRQYIRERDRREKVSMATGVALTLAAHAALAVCGAVSGFTYLDPPPPEREMILIDFEQEQPVKVKQNWNGTHATAAEPDRTQPINLVQASEAQHEGTKSNEAPEAKVDDFGDVDVPDPEPKKEIDRRALFRTADNKTQKDTLAQQTAEKVSDALKAGHALGNTKTGDKAGTPNAKLEGRTLNGSIPKPAYGVQASGKVVVDIWVDNYGDVQKAVAGAEGTTVTDKTLWQEARKSALNTHFNMSAEAPALQKGTITYIFNLD